MKRSLIVLLLLFLLSVCVSAQQPGRPRRVETRPGLPCNPRDFVQAVDTGISSICAVDGLSWGNIPAGTGAPSNAAYITQTPNGTLSAEQALSALASGLLKNHTGDGVLSIAAAGTDYVAPGAVTTSGLTQATGKLLGRSTAGTGAIEEITLGTGLTFSGTTLNAAGGGTPGGSDTQVQFNDSNAFAGNSAMVFDKTKKMFSLGDGFYGFGTDEDVVSLDIEQAYTGDLSNGGHSIGSIFQVDPTVNGALATGIYALTQSKSGNSKNFTYFNSVFGNGYHKGTGTVTWLENFKSSVRNQSTGTITHGVSYSAYTPLNSGGGTINDYTAFYSWDIGSVATNNYFLWLDSPGVFRVKADGVMAYYNPSFTKYTPGAANYERIVQQWNTNVAEIGPEAGGTGTQRNLRLLGATVEAPSATPLLLSNAGFHSCTALATDSSGNVTCSVSDERKKNIGLNFRSGLASLRSIKPMFYTWKSDPKAGQQAGLIAQNVRAAIPVAVSETGAGVLQIKQNEMNGVFVNALNELRERVETLERQNKTLRARLRHRRH